MNQPTKGQPVSQQPVVLCLSGLDPSGGAGLSADIESIAAQGGHCAGIATALTVQNSRGVSDFQPISRDFIARQLAELLDDMQFSAIKTGMLADANLAKLVCNLAQDHAESPLVIDPVIKAGKRSLALPDLIDALRELIGHATVCTPNLPEAAVLAECDEDEIDLMVRWFANTGCRYLLLTGGQCDNQRVINRLYDLQSNPLQDPKLIQTLSWPRLTGEFHGTGCTLAATLATRLALGESMQTASRKAQTFTWKSLQSPCTPGTGQQFPNRLGK
ncbi:bifunctional hydroxymethylpyrimidine kinase/phosphomethylpyrimidine kinase [Pelagibaculum spongiae]|uniref:hydroxymethylpyrimidine kinase n=1 Tax=Pelagibaculum spongiae TaxID=2080658 RepID=A0A2V1H091_9GAMM|nr:hydroxymethylpyrimidine/phosphomethylpyrimidine kinase [Pelagibaculum spongiae]PVZ67789.1 bifunctional hydroxymethylpyrimidine kinase/phosphomethylpyrimidine kinase [Pelagibaculum spongiae]